MLNINQLMIYICQTSQFFHVKAEMVGLQKIPQYFQEILFCTR